MDSGQADERPSILLVEDNFLLAELMRDEIEDLGCLVVGPAGSVEGALELLDASVSAALLDINLGDELVTPVAERACELGVPFVFLSAYTDGSMLPDRFHEVPFHTKPLSRGELASMVKGLVASRS